MRDNSTSQKTTVQTCVKMLHNIDNTEWNR